jgi:hypothetical protein
MVTPDTQPRHVEPARTGLVRDEMPVDDGRPGSGSAGVISVHTRFRPGACLLLSSRTHMALATVTLVVTISAGGACAREGQPNMLSVTEQSAWVTVTDIDGVRFDMPRQPEHRTMPIPGTDTTADLYRADVGDLGMAASATRIPGDSRTDAQILRDAANGMAANIDGTVVVSRRTVVDGAPGLDFEVTTPRAGGLGVFARVALADDLLVSVETVFDQDDRDVATGPHDRISRSIRFEG